MTRASLLAGAFLVAAVAGCIGADDGTDRHSSIMGGQKAPEWEIGHWWTYETNVWGEITVVVFDDHGDYWHMETTNGDLAWDHLDDAISFLGMVNKTNLAGSQEEEVRYFDFPLEVEKNWTTHWTGYDLLIEVKWFENGTFHLHGYHPDGWHRLSYDYDPAVGWFTDMVVYDEDHEAIYVVDFVDHGRDFQDEVAVWDYTRHGAITENSQAGNGMIGFEVDADATDLWVQYAWECDTDFAEYRLFVHPGSLPAEGETVEGGCETTEGTIVIEGVSGEWTVRATFASLPGASSLSATAYSRTLTWATLGGEAPEDGDEGDSL